VSPRRAGSRWRFPGGSAALPPALVGEIQRARIFEALCVVMAERGGFARTSVAAVLEHADMSTKTFYDYFADQDDCVRAAHRFYVDQLEFELTQAWAAPSEWVARVRAALAALLAYGEAAPARAAGTTRRRPGSTASPSGFLSPAASR
jgi:AcrR family transcriptional regulator